MVPFMGPEKNSEHAFCQSNEQTVILQKKHGNSLSVHLISMEIKYDDR